MKKPERRAQVLIVDDEPADLELCARILGQTYDVTTTPSPTEALELLHQQRYAVVLSDQRMPEMRGTDFLAQARRLVPDTARMILTGYASGEDSIEAINLAQVSAFLTKPIDPAALRQAVGSAVHVYDMNERNRMLSEELEKKSRQLREAKRLLSMSVDERQRALIEEKEWLQEASIRDRDTGLYNEKYFHERVHEELSRCDRYGAKVAVVIAEIDGYVEFQDSYGTAAADTLFFGIVKLMASNQESVARLRPMDIVARYRQESVALVLPSTPREGAIVVCKRVRAALADHAPEASSRLPEGRLTMSFGIAEGPVDGKTGPDILAAAETALRRARAGRNRIVVFG